MIDAAVHLWSADPARYPWAADATQAPPTIPAGPDALFHDLATAGGSRAVVIQSSSYGDDHRFLLDQVAAGSGRLAGVGLVRARGAAAAAQASALLDAGCAGLRVIVGDDPAWPASPSSDEVCAIAESRGVPLGLLAAPGALVSVAELAHRHPALSVVLDHVGLVGPHDLEAAQPALARLASAPNAHVKVSALRAVSGDAPPFPQLAPVLAALRDMFGFERLIYGTDWPYAVEEDAYTATRDALDRAYDWSDGERERVLEGNAAALWWPRG